MVYFILEKECWTMTASDKIFEISKGPSINWGKNLKKRTKSVKK